MDLKGSYQAHTYAGKAYYTVVVTDINISKKDEIVKSITGNHLEGKSNEDVRYLSLQSQQLNFLPIKVNKIYLNLEVLELHKCDLFEISSRDLRGLENLKMLKISETPLTSLPSNLLQNMKTLERICFNDNQLQYLSPKLVSWKHSKLLTYVSFKGNKSINTRFPGKCSTLKKLKDKIKATCKTPIEDFFQLKVSHFSEKFWDLWLTGNFSDFTIETDTEDFKVHKNILSIHSSVLATAFQIDMKESKSNRMKIVDFSSDAVEEFLKYFYCGEITKLNAMEVFALAAKYDVPELKDMAEAFVAVNVDQENAVKVLKFGNVHESDIIMRAAFTQIKMFVEDPSLHDKMMKKPEELYELVAAKRDLDRTINISKEAYKQIYDKMKRNVT
jgi:Leucine-rich repeat (LRR) protein